MTAAYRNEDGTAILLRLANEIQRQVSEIQKHLIATSQSNPSFDGQAQPIDWTGVDDTRSEVIDNLCNLHDLLLTPRELLRTISPTDYIGRHAIDRFDVLEAVPVDGTITYDELAKSTKLPVKTVRSILRHAMTQRVFYEPSPGIVAHTQASKLMAENDQVRDWIGTVSQEVWPAATRICDAIERQSESGENQQAAYELAHGKTLNQTLAEEPLKQARYDSAMGAFANDRSFGVHHVIENFEWAALGEATVVDVGGGIGTVSKALAKAFPSLIFVVEDRPDVLLKAEIEDPELEQRIWFLEHDIFKPQPIKNAAVYFVRRVLMEFDDEKAVHILRALTPALKRGAVVLLQDAHVPPPGSCPIWQERKFRNSDMLTLALSGLGQRDTEEWRALFQRVDPSFDFQGVKQVPSTDIAFIEARWRGEGPVAEVLERAER